MKPCLWAVVADLNRKIATWGNLLKCIRFTERLNKLTESYVVSNQKIKSALAKELPIKTREGLKKTILSFKTIKR